MDVQLRDKCVVITGGSAGIGKGLAMQYLAEGCFVAVCGRGEQALTAFENECAAAGYGDRFLAFQADVTDNNAMRSFRDAVLTRFGRLDIWVNNAGVTLRNLLMDATEEEWRTMMDVNLRSVWQCAKLAAEHMREAGGGVIVNTSSYASKSPKMGSGLYAASKWGVSCLTRSLAGELAPSNIRVFGFLPGVVMSEMTKAVLARNPEAVEKEAAVRRYARPEDIAPVVVFLSSPLASYVTGVDIDVSGGKFCIQNPDMPWSGAEIPR
ncbi:SDR family oxidoreductase [Desulfovibrio sp. OttesenSCG-928-I05]|nr:SDR family oxidoreductase [Desulfovibrio sp. OttesenSCG-928-I05]